MRLLGEVPIKWRLLLLFLATSVATLLLVDLCTIPYELSRLRQAAAAELTQAAQRVGAGSAVGLARQDGSVTLALPELTQQAGLRYTAVYDANGSLAAQQAAPAAAAPPTLSELQALARAGKALQPRSQPGRLETVLPIVREGKQVGSVIAVSEFKPAEFLAGYLARSALALSGVMVLMIVVWWQVRRLVSEPVLELGRVAKAVGQNTDFSLRVAEQGRAEVRRVITDFNEMLSRVQAHEQGLRGSEERFRQVTESIREVLWVTDVSKSEMVYVSPAYEFIWGRSCASLYENPAAWMEAIHPKDKARVARASTTLQASGDYNEIYRIVRPDGALRWIQDRAFPIKDHSGRIYRVAGIAEDVTARKTAEQRLSAQNAVAQALANSESLAEAAPKILRAACETMDFQMAALWEADVSGVLTCVDLLCMPGFKGSELARATRERKFRSGEGFPGQVCVAGKAIWLADLQLEPRFAGAPPDLQAGLQSALGFPILLQDGAIGMVELFSSQVGEPEEAMLQLLNGLGNQMGQFVARKRAEEALRKAEAKYRSIYENAAEGIFQTTPDGRYISANPELAHMLGYASPQELIEAITSIGSEMCVDPTTRDYLKARLDSEGSVRGFENRIYRKDGTVIWTSVNAHAVRDDGGRVLYYEGTSQDITARKEAERQLAMLAHAVESTDEMICITDLQDRFIFANRAFQRAYGYSEAEIIGKTPAMLFAPSNPPPLIDEILQQTRAGGWRGEVIDRRRDGSEFPVFLSTSQVKDSAGRTIGLMGVAQDISARKKAEEQIRLLADAVHSAGEMISIGDEGNRFIFVNAAFLNSYGYSEAEILGRTPEFLYSNRNAPNLCQHVLEQTLRGSWSGEILNRRKDGSEFPISLTTSPIKTASGTVLGLVGVAHDISERKRAEKQMTAFSWLGYRLSAASTPLQAAEIIFRVGSELFGWDAGYFHLYDQVADKIVPVLTMDTMDGQRVQVSSDTFTCDPSPWMRSVMEKGARVVNRPADPAMTGPLTPFGNTARPSASMMYVPIHSSGTVLGILSLQSYSPRAYSESDLKVLQALADQCGGALHRIQVTEALRASERKLRLIAENTRDVIFAFDLQRRPIYVNPAVCELTGYSMAELQDDELLNWVHHEDRRSVRKHWEELYHGHSRSEVEFRLVTRAGAIKWCSSSWGPLMDETGRNIGVQGHVRDITERKQLEREVLESTANERRRIGHELHDGLGQYLAGIAFRAKALEQSLGQTATPSETEVRELVALISNAISQTRSLARGLDPVDVETIGLPAALQNLADETRKFFDVGCQFKCADTGLQLESQAGLSLYRIVQEAIHNAIRHGEANAIEISLEQRLGHVDLDVRDDGGGFEVGQGHENGMGLRVMQYRARSIGGTLKIFSGRGQGTRIHCQIPLAGPSAETSRPNGPQ